MAEKSLTLSELKRHLKSSSPDELINDITELFKRFDSVKDYYQVKLAPKDDTPIREKYKKIIKNEFFPARGLGKAKLSVAKKAVSDYKKVSANPAGVADVMLFYVEQGVQFTNEYGDIDESFYNSMESMYENVLKWLIKCDLRDEFQARCQKIVTDTSHIGWGVHDGLSDLYQDAFE